MEFKVPTISGPVKHSTDTYKANALVNMNYSKQETCPGIMEFACNPVSDISIKIDLFGRLFICNTQLRNQEWG